MKTSNLVLGAGTLVHRDRRVLLVKRAVEPDIGKWAFPGGRVEPGETPAEAAVRETLEEVGLDVELQGVFDVVTYFPEPAAGRTDKIVIVDYLAKPLGAKVKLDRESSDFRWLLPGQSLRLRTTPQMKACLKKFATLGIR